MSEASIDAIVTEVFARPARGRRPAPVAASVKRELVAGDIERLNALPAGSLGTEARPLQRLRHSHHALAQALASGVKQEECALLTGYDPQYISNIQKDPAFKNLFEHYRGQSAALSVDVTTRLRAIGIDSLDELQSRLAETPKAISTRELLELAELGLDRSGHGPASNVNLNARHALVPFEQIQRIKQEARLQSSGAVLELSASPHDPRPAVGAADGTPDPSAPARAEGGEGGGPPVSEGNREKAP